MSPERPIAWSVGVTPIGASASNLGRPEQIMAFGSELAPNRLGLANWLTSAQNPLASRVAVNRLWQIAFGQGIVGTPEDFGSQGAPPSHPDLLDALAIEFIESGWDTKAMLRRFYLSATYRQSSTASEQKRSEDPENRLLSRVARRRLSAEMLRDQALSASGLLVERIGGASVFPYEPAGLWAEKSGQTYPQGKGEALYRRSLYTFWKRTSPPPSMMILDAAKRDVCVVRRQATSTPLQSLVVLNDPQFTEAARALGERVLLSGVDSTDERVGLAFRLLTSRHPREEELALLVRLYDEQLAFFQGDRESADALLSVGEREVDGTIDRVELGALTIVCATLFGHDEAMTTR